MKWSWLAPRGPSGPSGPRGIAAQLAVAAGVASALFAATTRVVFHHLSEEQADGHVVNLAGRQRMLAQRMAREALEAASGDGSAAARLQETGAEFQRSLEGLTFGDRHRGLPPASAAGRAHLMLIAADWSRMVDAIEKFAGNAELREGEAATIVRLADLLTEASEQAVAGFDAAFATRVRQLRSRMTLLSAGGAVVLAGTYLVLLADARRRTARAEGEVARKEFALEELARERRELVRRLLTASEDERRRVATDIHDGPTQQLIGASMLLEAAISDAETSPSVESVTLVQTYLESAIEETRLIISDLRPPQLKDLGVAEAIVQSLATVARDFDVKVEIDSTSLSCRPNERVEMTLYRVAHEAAINAIRHSGTSAVSVTLGDEVRAGPGVLLTVSDGGSGFRLSDVGPTSGHLPFGLLGMRERVELLDGCFEVDSVLGNGTTIRAWIPTEDANSEDDDGD
ncbi:MAG: type IV pili methyl-accepting chemotaxis transducer N-terminal domain-containing protein [Dehalococcoidia bacterium]